MVGRTGRFLGVLKSARGFVRLALSVMLIAIAGAARAQAQAVAPTNETILCNFDGTLTNYTPSARGNAPLAGLVADSSGNLYGTTYQGGTGGWGAIFELVNSSGNYTEELLHSFAGPPRGGAGADGVNPSSRLVIDSSGNLYGTTQGGGAYGLGTVFELVNSSGTYTEKILYSFTGFNGDGAIPFAVTLVRDSAGNLYGTTTYGGSYVGNVCAANGGCGTVFELANSAASPGTYTERVLYSFTFANGDTGFPQTGLAMDQAGDLFGTSGAGGANGWGAVYELVNSSGNYSERVIYSFTDINAFAGDTPAYPVIVDSAGNLYGTTPGGGPYVLGTVFELANSTTSPGTYTIRLLHTFQGGTEGAEPLATLTMDAAGNLYGTTAVYGGPNGGGSVFELANVSGSYNFEVLYDFGGRPNDGVGPQGRLLMDSIGNLYGTTGGGGLGNGGTVFMLSSAVPPAVPAIWLSTSNLTFASAVGVASAPQSIKAGDSGTASITFGPGGVTITGADAADFSLADYSCSGQTLAPGATCQVSITFTASAVGPESATLSFTDNAANSPQTVSLSGTGLSAPIALLTPGSLAFSPQLVNTTSDVQTVSVSNSGGSNLTFANGSITLSGTNAADFAIASTSCNYATVFAASACSVGITFTPSIVGTETATLSLSDNAAGSPQTVGLTGTGVSSSPSTGSLPQNEKVLYSFTGSNGAHPGEGLISDASGDLFGTTEGGPTGGCFGGCGTVFELVNSSGRYTEKLLYSFAGTSDGAVPMSRLIMDSSGNLYGTTNAGGGDGFGTVFELVNNPAAPGTYTEKVLHSFESFTTGPGGDGVGPSSGVTADNAGDLYGTTSLSGAYGWGTVYELVKSNGAYSERILYSFTGRSDGASPSGSVTLDSEGNIYGATTSESGSDFATVFELVNTPASPGTYTARILGAFASAPIGTPLATLSADRDGNLYGTGSVGNLAFELASTSGSYILDVLHTFGSTSSDGASPQGRLIEDSAGNFYGTTYGGGTGGLGTVFRLSPAVAVALSPTSVQFGNAVTGSTSTAQAVTVTNSGKTNVVFGTAAVTISGANAGDFVLSADSCSGATVAPGATCSVGVTFTPSLVSGESATLDFTDNAANSPQTVNLTGTGATPDFSIGVASGSSSSASISPGGTATYSLNVGWPNGFTQPIALTCAGAPSKATCSVSPSTVTPDGTNPASVTVTVTTTASTLAPPLGMPTFPGGWPTILLIGMAALLGLALLAKSAVPVFGPERATGRRARLKAAATLAAALLTVALWASCGGGGGGGGTPPVTHVPGTPIGNYTLTITGNSNGLTHSTTVTLTVQ